jgi:hypothetical protein
MPLGSLPEIEWLACERVSASGPLKRDNNIHVNKGFGVAKWLRKLNLLEDIAVAVDRRVARRNNRAIDIESGHGRDRSGQGRRNMSHRTHCCRLKLSLIKSASREELQE